MIKRTIEISRQRTHLSVKLDQLRLQPYDQPKNACVSIPCEDVGLILVDESATTYTHQALAKLMEFGAAVVICGRDHLPSGLLLPLSSHTQVVWRVQDQIAAAKPMLKRLWRQIVVAKVQAQAQNLADNHPARGLLTELTKQVKSGDATNVEAQAARVYWSSWLDGIDVPQGMFLPRASDGVSQEEPPTQDLQTHEAGFALENTDRFRRDPQGLDLVNVMLNYGYAVLRAAVARSLVSAGLFPALGLHHRNRSNAFCLADDLIEPLRPLIDSRVRGLIIERCDQLDQAVKARLIEVLHDTVRVSDQTGPLMVGLHRMAASLARCYAGLDQTLSLPRRC